VVFNDLTEIEAHRNNLERLVVARTADLAQSNWIDSATTAPYDAVVSLAVFHHCPGYELRQRLLMEMAGLLAPGGMLALSTWLFLSTARFAQRTLTWDAIGLSETDVEPGDALAPERDARHGRLDDRLFS
jgi:2-polyprenyl-3-methyl-5-hydroxy-6-metoxy-1,4-benzoquinol methylase